jgi:transcriptional regulator with XRE-family HTH domain
MLLHKVFFLKRRIAMFLREKREDLRLTQNELGEHLGVSANTISRWERGDITPEHPKMLELALVGLELKLTSDKKRERIEELKSEVQQYLEDTDKILSRMNI